MDVCFQVLKESNKSRFDSLQCQEQCIDHNSHYLVTCIFFSDNLSRNSCIIDSAACLKKDFMGMH